MGKKLQPKLRFRGFTDAWEQHKLGSLGTSYSGLSGKDKTDFGHGSGSYITYLNVFQNPIADIDGTDRIEIDPKQNTVHYGDVFFTVSSETPEEVGMSSVWLGNQQNIYLNSFCFGYRQNGTFDTKYLAYVLRSRSIRNRMKVLAQGISRFNISQRRVMDIEVSFPSMDEQQKIGVLCGKLDQLIDAEKRKLDLLKQKKKALLHQIFEQKLRFKGYNNPWERRKGSDIIHVRKETNSKPLTDTVDIELENLIEGGGLQGDISLRTASTSVFREHDTLFGRLRPYLRKCWLADISGVKSGEIWALFSPTLKSEFLYALTQSAQFLNPALQTAGTKMPRAEWKAIAEACFTIPETDEQEKIGQLFRQLEHLTAVETRKIDLLSVKKKALLQKMFV